MATYLVTATFGHFQVKTGRTKDGIPIITAVDPREAKDANPALAKLPKMIAFEEKIFGPYPFDTVGAIVDDAPQVGYALETQTKPVFDGAPDDSLLLHELAHQWYGDSVALTARLGGNLYAERVVVEGSQQTKAMGFWSLRLGLSFYFGGGR